MDSSSPPVDAEASIQPKAQNNIRIDESTHLNTCSEVEDEANGLLERRIRLKVDFRLCSIAGILCSLNLLDSGVISNASVTSMLTDLELDKGNRYSVAIFIFTCSSIAFQLPATVAVRTFGPRKWFSAVTFSFGVITLCTGFIHTWQQMIFLRILLGASTSAIYPGLMYLISTWYTRQEQQLRFAFLQSGQVIVLATGNIVNYGLNKLDGRGGLSGWRWMFVFQGLITCVIGIVTYWWIVEFPETSDKCFKFLSKEESTVAAKRIHRDRGDVHADAFAIKKVLVHAADIKVYGFAILFFLQNIVSTALSYFLPLILEKGMGFSSGRSILLSAPPYYWAVIPAALSAFIADRYRLRGPVIVFNAMCLITGFAMLGFSDDVALRYFGTFVATGAFVANWAALSAYQANNVVGQWKRVFTSATCTAFNGAGGVAGSYIVRSQEAPKYVTAVCVSIGSHIVMIAVVAALSAHFALANRAQKEGRRVLEKTVGFRFTF